MNGILLKLFKVQWTICHSGELAATCPGRTRKISPPRQRSPARLLRGLRRHRAAGGAIRADPDAALRGGSADFRVIDPDVANLGSRSQILLPARGVFATRRSSSPTRGFSCFCALVSRCPSNKQTNKHVVLPEPRFPKPRYPNFQGVGDSSGSATTRVGLNPFEPVTTSS